MMVYISIVLDASPGTGWFSRIRNAGERVWPLVVATVMRELLRGGKRARRGKQP